MFCTEDDQGHWGKKENFDFNLKKNKKIRSLVFF